MNLIEHEGPKAQIFVRAKTEPLWFSQARDGVLVADMESGADWSETNDLTWIAAEKASFVIDSERSGAGRAMARRASAFSGR